MDRENERRGSGRVSVSTTPEQFLISECSLLDRNLLEEWLTLLDRNISYRMPVRLVTDESLESGFSTESFYYDDDYSSLSSRIERLIQEDAWAEHPRTRTRRILSNIQVIDLGQIQNIVSHIAVFCWRYDATTPVILTAERMDSLCLHDGEWKLSDREVLLDSTVLGLESLSILL